MRHVGKWFAQHRPQHKTLAVLISLAFIVGYRVVQLLEPHGPGGFDFASAGPYLVERVVDGDTLRLHGGTRVRLLGVDTPEINHPQRGREPWGLEAADFTRARVEGRHVTLRFDAERRDNYGRVLAYVDVDDQCLNTELIRAGLSAAETRFPYSSRMKRIFLEAEAEARAARRGVWSADD